MQDSGYSGHRVQSLGTGLWELWAQGAASGYRTLGTLGTGCSLWVQDSGYARHRVQSLGTGCSLWVQGAVSGYRVQGRMSGKLGSMLATVSATATDFFSGVGKAYMVS